MNFLHMTPWLKVQQCKLIAIVLYRFCITRHRVPESMHNLNKESYKAIQVGAQRKSSDVEFVSSRVVA
jgi:hypothetical protein